jgi:integrase/recombinase XerD|tara:strand:+ start:198 stop:1343 length:1146 start_codon:yes stop_codon:yes gene_type:complete
MASLVKRRGKYLSRVSYTDEFGRQKQIEVPLHTSLKSDAEVRQNEVERYTTKIQADRGYKQIAFKWLKGGGRTKILQRPISECVDNYIAVKRIDGVRPKTIAINELALNSFMNLIGYKVPIKLIDDSHIGDWKRWSRTRHAPITTNIYLAKIKTFFRYCYKKKYIKRELDIEKVKANAKPPMYLSETKLGKLFSTDMVDEHFRKAFLFYAMTGCRLAEPFEGVLSGDWLIITPDVAKSHTTREIQLNHATKSILLEMLKRYDERIGKAMHGTYKNSHKGIIDTYSKEFKKCAKALGFGEHKFHNLRDTYAVRRWIETGDIYLVSKEIGHKSVVVTQKYADFNLRRLKVDFPSLKQIINSRLSKTVSNESLLALGSGYLQLD